MQAATGASTLRAGVAREIISPPPGLYLIGYGDRLGGNTGVHDDLTATALVLEAGSRYLALVACDLLCLNDFVVDRVRAAVGEEVDVVVSCSHTHAGPIAYADGRSSPRRRAYIRGLVDALARTVRRAAGTTVPVRLWGAQTEVDIAVNRREPQPDGSVEIGVNPYGPVDRTVNVVRVVAEGGVPLATLVNLACHGTVLGPENREVSADWIGAMRRHVEAALGGKVLFLQGATADLNPMYNTLSLDEDPWAAVEALGERAAEAVVAACEELAPLAEVPLRWRRREVWLPLEARATTARPPRTYRRVLADYAGLPAFLGFVVDLLLRRRYPWRSRVEARAGVWSVPLRVNAVRLGDVGLITFGAETFTEIGRAIKAQVPTSQTLFASVTDGCIGYLPTAEAHARGGPEVDLFSYFYRYPARFASESAERAIDAAVALFTGLC
ncbi:MAG: neutral/alkaline non-lysosomal ceramidase N-terminal domain-containing protein [Anaerolineae bacterium]